MKRALPWILTLLAAGGVAAGLYALGRRHPAPPPSQGPAISSLFSSAPAGQGWRLSLQAAPDQPLRTVRFLPPLREGWVLAQVLTQTGDQLLGRFQEGRWKDTLRVPTPEGVPAAFFRFARLEDAVQLDNGTCLLLYGDGTGSGNAPWLVAFDPFSARVRWALRGAGDHLVLGPDGQSCLLWGPGALARATWAGAPRLEDLGLPAGVQACDAVVALPDGRVALAHPGGLALLGRAGWTSEPLPDPGSLAFPGVPGGLAARDGALYWQARPGQLERADGGAFAPAVPPAADVPASRTRDLQLLHLAGADPRGRLWFTLANPDLTIRAAAPASPALEAAAALTGSGAAPQAPQNKDPGLWLDYLKEGLDRVYVWDPAAGRLRMVDWKAAWKGLGVPPDFPLPLPRDLKPGAGALLLAKDTEAWWLPLDRLAP